MFFTNASTPFWTCELHHNDDIHPHPQEPVANAPQPFFDFTICMSSNMLRKKHLFALLFAESLDMLAKYVFNEVIGIG